MQSTYIIYMIFQGHASAPGLDIMLLKQQFLHVSTSATNPASQGPPVEYMYQHSHPLLHFLFQLLDEWVANNLAEELNLPPNPEQSKHWSTGTAALNSILQSCFVSDPHGMNIHTFQSVEFDLSQICITGLCVLGVTHSIWNTMGEM
jgi:hypothetical protein